MKSLVKKEVMKMKKDEVTRGSGGGERDYIDWI
jgi:hypothetical protein